MPGVLKRTQHAATAVALGWKHIHSCADCQRRVRDHFRGVNGRLFLIGSKYVFGISMIRLLNVSGNLAFLKVKTRNPTCIRFRKYC
jgi:hypothetical protein